MIQMGQVSHWLTSQPEIVARPPSLGREHPPPVGMTAASCRCSSTVAPLEAPIGLQEAVSNDNAIQKQDHIE